MYIFFLIASNKKSLVDEPIYVQNTRTNRSRVKTNGHFSPYVQVSNCWPRIYLLHLITRNQTTLLWFFVRSRDKVPKNSVIHQVDSLDPTGAWTKSWRKVRTTWRYNIYNMYIIHNNKKTRYSFFKSHWRLFVFILIRLSDTSAEQEKIFPQPENHKKSMVDA